MSATLTKIARMLGDCPAVDDLLLEIGDQNRVRVTKYAAVRPDRRGRLIHRRVMDEEGEGRFLAPALVRLDELRMLAGLAPRYLAEALRLEGGELLSVTANLRTNVGKDYVTDSLGKSASRPAVAEYMAVSEDATAPAAGDTTITGEITTLGLARALSTYAHTVNTTAYTMTKTFTATGTFTAVQKEGLLNAAAAGTLFVENTFAAAALLSGDQLTVTHTVNI